MKRIQNIRQTSYPEAQQQIQESLTLDQSQDSLLVTFADYEGHLNVRLSPTQNWKKRYCMLKDGDLFVFKQSDQQRLLARVPIEKQYAVTPDDHQSKNKFSFRIVRADSRFIQFATESQLSMVQWITAFVRAGQSGIPFLIEYDILIELPRSGTDSDRKRKAQLLPVRRTKDTKPLPEVPA